MLQAPSRMMRPDMKPRACESAIRICQRTEEIIERAAIVWRKDHIGMAIAVPDLDVG